MSRRLAMVVAVVAIGLTSCATRIPGNAERAAPPSQPPSVSEESGPVKTKLPEPGQCTLAGTVTPLSCTESHNVEITKTGELGAGFGPEYPDSATVLKAGMPSCYAALPGYLGSPDFAASTLDAWLGWPTREQWTKGNRWSLCGVSELGMDGKALSRTAPLKGAPAGDGFYAFQVCSSVKPAGPELSRVSCATPHVGESVPGVLSLGEPGRPMPSPDAVNRLGQPHCKPNVDAYLGIPDGRPDVFYAWRWASEVQYRNGNTYLVCFAETQTPVLRPLRGIRADPLPR